METPHKDNECEKQLNACIENGEFTRKNIRSEFAAWRRKIRPLYEVLGTAPPNDSVFGKLIVEGVEGMQDDQSECLKEELLWKCQEVYDQLTQQVNARKAESSALWKELQGLWNELEENEELGLGFTNADSKILLTLKQLKSEYSCRKVDKSRRLQEFICELRKEISDIWEQCMITEEEKKEFVEFESCEFTERMLQVHKEELEKWKIYHKKNQEILVKIQKREAWWKKLRELESKANDPARFVNRGGSLLKDQNMHNWIMKNLPKLEAELVSLAEKFEAEHGKRMKILGQEIPEIIAKEWEAFKEEKSGRKAARTAPTPTKPILQSIRRSIAPTPTVSNNHPQIKPLEKRFGSKLELNALPPAKRTKMQPLKAIQND